jgi:hypothetical protein
VFSIGSYSILVKGVLMDLLMPKNKVVVAPLTDEELDAVTVVFHQFETGLREGCIFTKVRHFKREV